MLLQEYERRAAQILDPATLAYFQGGAGAERTLAANRAAFDEWSILPRLLRPMTGGGTALKLMGQELAHPFIVAPMAAQGLVHRDGEIAMSRAAAAQDGLMVLSEQASTPLERLGQDGSCRGWFQLYWAGQDNTMQLAKRAADAGYSALVLTLDAPISGVRDREIAAGFAMPVGANDANLRDIPLRPLPVGASRVFDGFMALAPDWCDLEWLCRSAPLPVLVKGVLRRSDARLAVEMGAQGVIVSNHGGRVLDATPPALRMLPAIAQEVGGQVPVMVDGGIRRGTDAFVALALGARAVLVGRPLIYALAADGARGVSQMLRILRDELEVTMALAGCRDLSEVTREMVIPNRAL